MSSKPTILLIEFNKESFQDEMSAHMLGALKSRASVIQSITPKDASSKITSLVPTTILITTADFAKKKHAALHSKVVEYARAGGTVIICGQFCNMISPPDFDAFFLSTWGKAWKFGNYHRSTYSVNPQRHPRLRDQRFPEKYCVKAVHIKGTPVSDMVYVSTEDSVVQSLVFSASPQSPAHRPDQAPVIFTSFGNGYLGYIGDVNQENETSDVIIALCSFKSSSDVAALLGDKTRCRVCLNGSAKKCAACKDVSYCSKECQKFDWKEHKEVCSGST
jgi:hypothetical protein